MKRILVRVALGCMVFAMPVSLIRAADNFFTDIVPTHPHFSAATALKNDGIISGFADGTFRPDQPVNRAEALKIILLGSQIPEPAVPLRDPFPDVPKDQWFASFVREGKARTIIQGTAEGTFDPTRAVNQAEALKMILLTNEIEPAAPNRNPFSNISAGEWFAPFYAEARVRQILYENEVNPVHELTRGELVQMMYRFRIGAQNYGYPIGVMSYYGDGTNGARTSSGAIFDNSKFTAAHRTLGFGTRLLVRSLTSSGAVVIEVTDRGPYAAFRNLDLSKAAFAVLENPSAGLLRGELQIVPGDTPLGPVETVCKFPDERRTIPAGAFEHITLDEAMPTLFRKNEIFTLSGLAGNASEVTVFWGKGGHNQTAVAPVEGGRFTIQIPFPQEGNFNLGIIPGMSGTASVFPVQIMDTLCIRGNGEAPPAVENLHGEIRDGDYFLDWESEADFYRVLFTQEQRTVEFFVNGQSEFSPPPPAFIEFQPGPAEVRVFAADLNSSFSMDLATPFSPSVALDLVLSEHHFADIDQGKMRQHNAPQTFRRGDEVIFSANFDGEIREDAALIFPDGSVQNIPLITKGQTFTFRFTPEIVGTYIVEINGRDGFALYNAPLYHEGFAPVLPGYFDLNPRKQLPLTPEINLKRDRLDLLRLINEVRTASGREKVDSDEKLNTLAQFRAEDMVRRNYFSHTDPEGKTVNDARLEFGISGFVAENIALDANLEAAHQGLIRSAIHLENILNSSWRYAGIGIAQGADDTIYVVELFMEEPLSNEQRGTYAQEILNIINERRQVPLDMNAVLTGVGNQWAERIAREDFFGTKAKDGSDLQEILRKQGISKQTLIFLYQYTSFTDFLIGLSEREDTAELFAEKWREIGVGLYVDEEGTISIVLLLK